MGKEFWTEFYEEKRRGLGMYGIITNQNKVNLRWGIIMLNNVTYTKVL